MKLLILILTVSATLSACRQDDGCTPKDTDCKGSWVMICNADNEWDGLVDCKTYGLTCGGGDCE